MAVIFQADNSGEFSLTWGQSFIWRIIKSLSPHDEHINMSATIDIGQVVDLAFVFKVVRSLVEDFDILRTTFPLDQYAKPIQKVHMSGEISIQLVSCTVHDDIDRITNQLCDEMQNELFDIENGPTCRLGVVSFGEVPKRFLIAVSHMTMDGLGLRQLIAELKERLGLMPANLRQARTNWQPSSQVCIEQSEEGSKDSSDSMDYWRGQLCKAPTQSKSDTPFQEMSKRYWHGRLESAALDHAAEILASRLHISLGSVLLGTLACLLGYVSGQRNPLVIMRVSNRFDSYDDGAIGHLSQDVPIVIPVDNMSFSEILMISQDNALESYQYARYDPEDLVTLVTGIEKEMGLKIDRGNSFNCMKSALASNKSCDELNFDLHELQSSTKFSWIDKRESESINIFVYAPQESGISVFADTKYLPPAKIRLFAYAFERILIDASGGEDRLSILLKQSGLLRN